MKWFVVRNKLTAIGLDRVLIAKEDSFNVSDMVLCREELRLESLSYIRSRHG